MTLYANWKYNGRGRIGGGGSGGGGGGSGGSRATKGKIIPDPLKINAVPCCDRKMEQMIVGYNHKWLYSPITNKWQFSYDDPNLGLFAKNVFINIDKHIYYFDNDGIMVTGWIKDPNGNYYLLEWHNSLIEGSMMSGWQKVNGIWYYFSINGELLTNTVTPDGHIVNNEGEWIDTNIKESNK